MKKLATIVILTFLLAGCSSEEKIIDELKSEVEGQYNIVIFDDEMTSGELFCISAYCSIMKIMLKLHQLH
ncbi:hypothetical protein AB1K89_07140 [Sporosarcina sp. 179-K 8C2 HS]|uniref:hypothetical protein n=1 Tax=Sporosarcina sp. 179-K 8C2 HS TaxID=3142387 RepID=UPI00399F77AF